MKKVLFLLVSIVILGLVFAGCGGISNITTPSSTVEQGVIYLDRNGEQPCQGTYPLYAGQDNFVGQVIVTDDGANLCVEYVLDQEALNAGWLIYETHIAVGKDPSEIPQTKHKKDEEYGNPKVGHFPYGDDDLGGVPSYEECGIPIPDVECGFPFVIAAHAVVKKLGDLEGLDLILPDQAVLCIDSQLGPNGYFGTTISGGTVLDGFYDGYCIDTGSYIDTEFCGSVEVYSSYEEFPPGLVDYPGNLDLVNYIMNQDYIGKASSCGGAYTIGDVQWAIWQLVDVNPNAGCCAGLWEQCRVNEILADANANGEDYEPVCGEKAVVILVPIDGSQPIIIMVDVPCEGDETAWAAACAPGTPGSIRFVNQGNWATYFTYTVEECCEECCDFNAVDNWELDMYIGLTPYARFIIITNQVDGVINGLFGLGYDITGAPTGIITGTIDGCLINMLYERTDIETDYTAAFEGTIDAGGDLISGKWSDYARTNENWTMTRQ